ncbi:putative ribonuclease H-like domain-containing protein [Tanacetum coccineum]
MCLINLVLGFGIESCNSMECDIFIWDETLTVWLTKISKEKRPTKQYLHLQVQLFHLGQMSPFTGIDELAIRNKVVNQEKTYLVNLQLIEVKVIFIIEDWVDSDDEVELMFQNSQRKTAFKLLISLLRIVTYMKEPSNNQSHNTKGLRGHGKQDQFGTNIRKSETCNFSRKLIGSTVRFPSSTSTNCQKSAMINPKQTWRPKGNYLDSVNRDNGSYTLKQFEYGNPEEDLKDYAIIDSGCSGSMTGDKDKLSDFKEFKGGYVAFGNDSKGGRISGKGTIKTSCLDFEKVSYVEELKFNLLSVSKSVLTNSGWVFSWPNKDENMICFMVLIVGLGKQARNKVKGPSGCDNGSSSRINKDRIGLSLKLHRNHASRTYFYLFIFGRSKSLAKAHNDDQRIAFEEEKRRISIAKGKELVNSTFTLKEPKKVSQALADESWVEAMQEELLQFKLQEVWVLCDLPEGKRVIGTKWVFRNKRDERGTIIKNKARLVAQGYRQEEGVDYDEVFAPVARIEAIRLFLAFASFMGFTVYQMDVKSAFLYGNITEEVYVKQPPGFEDPAHPNKVYRVVKALYGLHQAPRAWYERLSTFLLKHGYRRGAIDKTLFIKKDRRDIMLVQVYVDDIIFGSTKSSMVKDFEDLMQKEFKMSSMGELTFFLGLQVKQSNGGIFLSQDKYVKDILNKFDFRTIKPASTPIEAHKSLGKDEEGEDVDVHLYRSMIGCLMYLTASRPDIMFAVCLCARFQVTPKVSHLHAVKRIFRYLKHQPNLGLWYPKDSPFHLEAFSDSDYAGDNHDRRSTSGGCQYLGRRLVSWQCKKQTIVAISSTEAEYVAAASCCAQVLWMQNQLLDYGFNFMNTEIHIDNESTICIVKNPVFHSKTKHIQIRHHFIRDCYEQRLINVVKVHTDDNVADLLTKGFDLARFNFLVVTIGMMNP